MIDKETLRIARRTAERNGYTVLPPRDQDERDLNRFRDRQRERDVRSSRFEDDDDDMRTPRFKPLRNRPVDDVDTDTDIDNDTDYSSRRRYSETPRFRDVADEYEPERRPMRPERPSFRDRIKDTENTRTSFRRPVRDAEAEKEDMISRAIKTAADNGYTVSKMSKLDQAKKVAADNGFSVRKMSDVRTRPVVDNDDDDVVVNDRPVRTRPVVGDDDVGNDRPVRRVATRDGEPMRRPIFNREPGKNTVKSNDGVHTRTAPDAEIKNDTQNPAVEKPVQTPTPTQTQTQTQTQTPPEPKKPSFEDDYVNRAAAFFGDDE